MKPATEASQRPPDARLLVADADGRISHHARGDLAALLGPGDLLVANDAATLPASLSGTHRPSGAAIEVRLAGRGSLEPDDVHRFTAVVFGAGDFRTRTEDRLAPPPLAAGDQLALGPLDARIVRTLGHPRLVELSFAGTADQVRAGIARHGRPVQYAHLGKPLAVWDVWTRIAAQPVAFEPPSAGFALDWRLLDTLRERGVGFATLTHAAGLSSTGDGALDATLPFDEPYDITPATVRAIDSARRRGGRVIALGTTVTRALEHAVSRSGGLEPGRGVATHRIGRATQLRVVDAIISGVHEPASSHHELLRAFVGGETLRRIDDALAASGYRGHEFGDSVWITRRARAPLQARSNLNTATLASRFGQVRTTLPA